MSSFGRRIVPALSLGALAACAVLASSYRHSDSVARALIKFEIARVKLKEKEFVFAGGTKISYLEGGSIDSDAKILVLVHGFGGDKYNFLRIAPFLTSHFRVIIPDLIGFGDSTRLSLSNDSYSYDSQALRLREFLTSLPGVPERIHLGGNSMGGGVVLKYAALFPNAVASLWLLAPAGVSGAPQSDLLLETVASGSRNPLLIERKSHFTKLLDLAMCKRPYIPSAVMNFFAQRRIDNSRLERDIFEQIFSSTSISSELNTPTLIVWGENDRILSCGTAPVLQEFLTNSSVRIMKNTGHAPMIEFPRKVAEDYLKFHKKD